jgi:hypothetical protein
MDGPLHGTACRVFLHSVRERRVWYLYRGTRSRIWYLLDARWSHGLCAVWFHENRKEGFIIVTQDGIPRQCRRDATPALPGGGGAYDRAERTSDAGGPPSRRIHGRILTQNAPHTRRRGSRDTAFGPRGPGARKRVPRARTAPSQQTPTGVWFQLSALTHAPESSCPCWAARTDGPKLFLLLYHNMSSRYCTVRT